MLYIPALKDGVFRKIQDKKLLRREGAGKNTHYAIYKQDLGASELVNLPSELVNLQEELVNLPTDLEALLKALPDRPQTPVLRSVIYKICRFKPKTAEQLAEVLGRPLRSLRNQHLTPMVKANQLQLRYPDKPNSPNQAYLAVDAGSEEI